MARKARARYKDPTGKVGAVETIKPHPLAEWFTSEELAIMASVSYDRNHDNGSLLKCDYTPPKR